MNIKEIVNNFGLFEDWEERYSYLISLGGKLPFMSDALKTDQAEVKGCMSKVWMVLDWDEQGRLLLQADSNGDITRGLVAILYIALEGKTVDEIKRTDIDDIFKTIGLEQHLTPLRRNGFFLMMERVRAFIAAGR